MNNTFLAYSFSSKLNIVQFLKRVQTITHKYSPLLVDQSSGKMIPRLKNRPLNDGSRRRDSRPMRRDSESVAKVTWRAGNDINKYTPSEQGVWNAIFSVVT